MKGMKQVERKHDMGMGGGYSLERLSRQGFMGNDISIEVRE